MRTNAPRDLWIHQIQERRSLAQATLDMSPAVLSTTGAALIGFPTDGTVEDQVKISLGMSSISLLLSIPSALYTNLDKGMSCPRKCTLRQPMRMQGLMSPSGSSRIQGARVARDLTTKVSGRKREMANVVLPL